MHIITYMYVYTHIYIYIYMYVYDYVHNINKYVYACTDETCMRMSTSTITFIHANICIGFWLPSTIPGTVSESRNLESIGYAEPVGFRSPDLEVPWAAVKRSSKQKLVQQVPGLSRDFGKLAVSLPSDAWLRHNVPERSYCKHRTPARLSGFK